MNPNASSSGITSLADYITLKILKTFEEIKAQMNTLGQRMDMLEVEPHDGGRNEERQLKPTLRGENQQELQSIR